MNEPQPQIITLRDMADAMLAMRKRIGDSSLSHCVRSGQFRLVRLVGRKVVNLSPWQDARAHLDTLNTYSPS